MSVSSSCDGSYMICAMRYAFIASRSCTHKQIPQRSVRGIPDNAVICGGENAIFDRNRRFFNTKHP